MIKQSKSYSADGHIAFIVGEKFNSIEGVSKIVSEQADKFIASEDETDFLKIGNQYVFFVKDNDNLEKIRLAAFDIRSKLTKTA